MKLTAESLFIFCMSVIVSLLALESVEACENTHFHEAVFRFFTQGSAIKKCGENVAI